MKPEAVVIEGTYWKRRMANITAEYKKWRLFYRDRFRLKPSPETENMAMDLDTRWPSWPKDTYSSLQSAMEEDFIMDFSDTLFSSFNPSQPFDFPNPREIAAKAGIADFIQPGLVQLQPSVDDFMDTFEPLSDLFSDFLNSKLPPLPEESMYNSNNMQDVMPSTSDQQDLFGSKFLFGRSTSTNVFTQSGVQVSSAPSVKRNNFRKSVAARSQQSRFTPPAIHSPFSGKPMIETMNSSPAGTSLLAEHVPLLSTEQPSAQSSSIQPFLCSNVTNQTSDNTTIESLLQGNLQNEVRSLQQNQESLPSAIHVSASPQRMKRERAEQYFQQPAFMSKSFDEADLSQQQPQHPTQGPSAIQVPLQSIPQGQIANTVIPSSNANEAKNSKHPLFFSVSLGQMNQSSNTPGNFKVPAQIPSITPASGNVYEPNMVSSTTTVVTNADSPAFRRHSYTTGQHLHSIPQSSGDYMSSRRSRPIAPATTTGNFVVPDVPTRQRTRSRSVSTPQSSSPKSFVQQPMQAVSLTDISAPLPTVVTSPDAANKRAMISGQTLSGTNSSILPQNAVLAQLLSSATSTCVQQDISQTVIKATNTATASVTSPVTIIRPILSTSAHTFVFSPLPVATAAGVNEFQRSLLMGTASQVFNNQNSPPSCVLPAPDSPGSSCSPSPGISNISFDPNSASKTVRLKSDEEKIQYKEHRRVCHINAEQKRRCNIKIGFESLHNLLPPLGQTPNAKVSKAAMLQRGADYIRTLKTERQQQLEEVEMLKKKIDELNQAISMYQSQLPASGAPVPCQRTNRMREMFEEYVRQQTLQNWKFWIFSLMVEPLVESYNNNVSTADVDEMCKSILIWLDQHCSLVALRPGVLNSLRHLSTTTNILSDPSRLPEEATRAVTKKENRQ
ncbi:Carbohydrate-responsive element-binding protein, partial [Stegodyphus mimosarum]